MPAHFTGKNFILLDRVSSTNSYVQELLSKSTPLEEGSVIMAVEQIAGKGQMGNFWEAEPGKNLTFYILYKPDSLAIEDHPVRTVPAILSNVNDYQSWIDTHSAGRLQ